MPVDNSYIHVGLLVSDMGKTYVWGLFWRPSWIYDLNIPIKQFFSYRNGFPILENMPVDNSFLHVAQYLLNH